MQTDFNISALKLTKKGFIALHFVTTSSFRAKCF